MRLPHRVLTAGDSWLVRGWLLRGEFCLTVCWEPGRDVVLAGWRVRQPAGGGAAGSCPDGPFHVVHFEDYGATLRSASGGEGVLVFEMPG
jgi:hypothetical protein